MEIGRNTGLSISVRRRGGGGGGGGGAFFPWTWTSFERQVHDQCHVMYDTGGEDSAAICRFARRRSSWERRMSNSGIVKEIKKERATYIEMSMSHT
jgi:hypothetical protein